MEHRAKDFVKNLQFSEKSKTALRFPNFILYSVAPESVRDNTIPLHGKKTDKSMLSMGMKGRIIQIPQWTNWVWTLLQLLIDPSRVPMCTGTLRKIVNVVQRRINVVEKIVSAGLVCTSVVDGKHLLVWVWATKVIHSIKCPSKFCCFLIKITLYCENWLGMNRWKYCPCLGTAISSLTSAARVPLR